MDFKLPLRPEESNKGTFGRVLNIAGSDYMPGAAYLSSVSALKIGCGYCFLASTERVIHAVSSQTQNIVFLPFKDIKKQKPDVISIGCGLTTSHNAQVLFKEVIKYFKDIPIIIDADGLNILAKNNVKLPEKTILTPHPMEAARLLNTDINQILKDLEGAANQISQKYNSTTVLKSHNTIVCSKELDIYVNKTGNSALAKAGSGDVLTGMISGLVAQKMDLYEAAKLGVYLHGLCGELASKKLTKYSVMADDLISFIPEAIKTLLPENSCN